MLPLTSLDSQRSRGMSVHSGVSVEAAPAHARFAGGVSECSQSALSSP